MISLVTCSLQGSILKVVHMLSVDCSGRSNVTAMSKTTTNSEALKYLKGPLILALFAGIYNLIARKMGHPTISQGVRWLVNAAGGPEVAGGIIGGLIAHWLINDGQGGRKWIR